MDLGLTNKVAVITGGDSGIGKATAERLVREGAKVALIDKTSDALTRTTEKIQSLGEVIAVQADLTQREQVEAAKQQILDRFGTVHILVHAAGITGATGDFLEISDQEWQETIEVDLMAAVRTCRAFLPLMRSAGWGRIVLVSSEDALQPYPEELPYCACKAAILNLAKGLSKAYAKDGVLVNSVSPAFIATPMTDAMMKTQADQEGIPFDQAIEQFLQNNRPTLELQRRGRPEEVADVIGFLCSERSSFVLGANWRVDGGSVASL
ncbi:SDR family NAD(P)-dependent oxidoreductase [Thermocoleostomius sinensis]|uniref:SDR family NAD(P)-dependent oxidoreductase n=1 Tax=Thermocoleostomius sinensis A174 TaxID=2016057 RepID=A0A9E8ZJA4_9CYAN|nr:SDR family oxidoreductase [Thermocoleostomius sinensis]WAL62288.1 SDR family NAD(P)-dependent oxidoreductase [Thermocoleostomius sinensis A174]